jgi:hypothetical protein
MIPDNISATNARVNLLSDYIMVLKGAIEDLLPVINNLNDGLQRANGRIAALEGYIDKVRAVVNVGPMFPARPEDGEYFLDEVTNRQYIIHKAYDEWDEDDRLVYDYCQSSILPKGSEPAPHRCVPDSNGYCTICGARMFD